MQRIVLDPFVFGSDQACFGCGPHNPRGLHLHFWREGDEVGCEHVPTAGHEGPPGILHGGLQATLADEVGAWTLVGVLGRFGLTTSLQLRYLRPARLGAPVEARGRISRSNGNQHTVKVTLTQDGATLLSGRISYVVPTRAQAEKVLGRPLPEAWARLAADGDP